MFGKKKTKVEQGIPSLTDKPAKEPLPESPKIEKEEVEAPLPPPEFDTGKRKGSENQIPIELKKQEIELAEEEVIRETLPEDEIPDEIDVDDETVEEGVSEEEFNKQDASLTKKLDSPNAINEKKESKPKLPEKFYTIAGITALDNGLIQTTIVSNVDLKMIVGTVYDMEKNSP